MPKRTIKVKLLYRNHRQFRLRTRREIKAYINALIANGKSTRKGTRSILRNARRDHRYWAKPNTMAVYFMQRIPPRMISTGMDDHAHDERFALKA